ncbi:ion transporter [Marinicellulosiphila megalodicopiae]|uniref:ion transporter n=1 Tax=Marinicellulosiphila megalodicopiae TaxID=2724896 RepID=UPI003BAE8A49
MTTLAKIQSSFQRVEKSRFFQLGIIFVILLSALSVGANTHDINWPKITVGYSLLDLFDHLITLFFVIEIIIRFLANKHKLHFFKSGWNIFDLLIVIGSLIPDDGSAVLLARLLRVFRVLRLVSMVPELRLLVNALLKAIPRMGYIALLMFVIFYIYAAAGSLMFEHVNPVLWGDVSISLLTLFRVATFEDWTDVMYETMAFYPISWMFYLSFIFLSTFIFLNMMVGTVLDVMNLEHEKARATSHGESLEEAEPSSRAQVDHLESEIEELKQMILELSTKQK